MEHIWGHFGSVKYLPTRSEARRKSLVPMDMILKLKGTSDSMKNAGKLDKIQETLRDSLLPDLEWRCETSDIPGAKGTEFDDSSWKSQGSLRGREWKIAWFRASFQVPSLLDGCSLRIDPSMGGTSHIYINGKRAGQCEEGDWLQTPGVRAGEKLTIAIRNENGWISYENPYPAKVWCERMESIRAAYEQLLFVAKLRDMGNRQAEDCLSRFLEEVDYDALSSGRTQDALSSLGEALGALKEAGQILKAYHVYVVPHSHVDLAWGWTYEETKRIMRSIFERATQIMGRNSEYTFAQDQPPAYMHLEGSELMEQISRYISEGRLEISGAMYSEPEGNLPCGESFIRQVMITKRYFLQRFGADPMGCWNLDSFSGHCWSLPQILYKSGVRYYTFANWGNSIPDVEFWWEGPDGSKVLAYHLPCHYDSAQMMEHDKIINNLFTYVSRSKFKRFMFLDGDDLTPPFEGSIEGVNWFNSLAASPSVKFSTSARFFADLENQGLGSLPVFRGELAQYMTPQNNNVGSYTAHCDVKSRNRECENLLLTAEKFGSIAMLLGLQYPRETMEEAWRKVLLNQMHDILPGTAIAEAYKEAHRAYDMAEELAKGVLTRSLAKISSRVDTSGKGVPIVVFNQLPWERTDAVEFEVTLPHTYLPSPHIFDAEGKEAKSQILHDSRGTYDKTNRNIRCLFLAEKVPPMGYKVFWLVMGEKAASTQDATQSPDVIRLHNEYLDVAIDSKTGLLLSLASNGHEYVANPERALLLERQVDLGDPWHIRLSGEPTSIRSAEAVEVTEQGPVRTTVEVRRRDGNTRILQRISVVARLPRLLCEVNIDCKDLHVLYKIGFPGLTPGAEAIFEIPFASISRKPDMDRPAQNWADLSDETAGISLLNRGRYGYDLYRNSLRLTLLRNPRGHMSSEGTDTGKHSTAVALYPHEGDWRSGAVRQGMEFNNPLLPFVDTSHVGQMPPAMSFLSVSSPSAIASCLKPHEDSEDLILRVYEAHGEGISDIGLQSPISWDAMEELDMVERAPLGREEKHRGVFLAPYEIRTFRLRNPRLKALNG